MTLPVECNKYSTTDSSCWKDPMLKALRSHPHWREVVSEADKQKLKDFQPYKSYIVSAHSASRFVIYYLREDKTIQKNEFTLDSTSKSWFFKNGIDYRSTDIDKVLAYILKPH